MKEAAYKSLVRPILEYESTVMDPHCNVLNDELENVQKRAAKFVTRNYSYETGSMTGILEELNWETLQKRRDKGLKGKNSYKLPYSREQALQKSTLDGLSDSLC